MKAWTKDIEINAPIETVGQYLDGSLEDMQKIMPQVVGNQPVKRTEEKVGSVYRQQYKEGKRIAEYDVETLVYSNTPEKKKLKVGFTLESMFEITAYYELTRLDENRTNLLYTCTNRPLKGLAKIFVMFATDKVVVKFLEQGKKTAESELNR